MYTVLYVDDEQDLLEISKLFLERSGQFNVDTITSAIAALALLRTKNYDAIISDYQMPEMDGIEFLKKVRTSGNTIPFILFTGRGREEVVIKALSEHADFYLQKGGEPTSQFTELAHQLRQAIQQRHAETSIRDLERREADIINFLPDATFAINQSGQIIAWNRAIEEMTGVPAVQMLEKGDHEYAIPFYGSRQPTLIDLISEPDEVIAGKYGHIVHEKDVLTAETTVPLLKGKPATLMVKASPLYNRRGEVVGAIELIRRVTGQTPAETALHEENNKLRLLSSITCHDISNQLATLQGSTKIAVPGNADPATNGTIEKIASAVITIQHQLEFTRIYQNPAMQAPAWVSVCDTIRSSCPLGITLACTCDSCEILADPMIAKVFFNLFENAAKHGGHVTTVTVLCERDSDRLVITFADNGVGIPPGEKQKIFEKGYGKNNGLGLFLSREILALTGISIRETGHFGNGARFEMTVPKGAWRVSGPHH
jgi:signal transduction histidine kinase